MGASGRRRCTAKAAVEKTPKKGHGACMAGAGRSQRQKARRRTISTVLSRFDPSVSKKAGGLFIPYQFFEEPDPAGNTCAMTGCGPESARLAAGGIDLPGSLGWRWVD